MGVCASESPSTRISPNSSTNHHQPPPQGQFLPQIIEEEATVDDFVLFKLDIDHGPTEIRIVEYMLNEWPRLDLLDEFVWEQHCDNYIMEASW